ncbi:hypothetical protein AAMO2058_000582600 [Amorphochlora amoebiformis]
MQLFAICTLIDAIFQRESEIAHVTTPWQQSQAIHTCFLLERMATLSLQAPVDGKPQHAAKTAAHHVDNPGFWFSNRVCEYNCVTNALLRSGLQRTNKTSLANVYWTNYLSPEQYCKLSLHQKVNHFPGSHCLGRKDNLVKSILRLRRHHGAKYSSEFSFLPETFLMPSEYSLFERRAERQSDQMWILKPTNLSCGKGIKVITKPSEVDSDRQCVVCKYIMDPYLINGRKFDMRIYVLITCFNPLRVYIYKDGLVRFATMKYTTKPSQAKERFIHLTNYSVNKLSENFVRNTEHDRDDTGSKWSVKALRRYFHSKGIDDTKVWDDVEGVIVKTLMAIEGDVVHRQRIYKNHRNSCFEILGFDVLLDSKLKPWLIEVNCSPSLSSSSPLDKRIKTQLMTDALHCCGVTAVDIKKVSSKSSKKFQSEPTAMETKKFRHPDLKLDASILSQHDIQVLRETYLERQRCGDFKIVYPTPKNCKRYGHLMSSPRYNNFLLEKWINMHPSKAESLVYKLPGVVTRTIHTRRTSNSRRKTHRPQPPNTIPNPIPTPTANPTQTHSQSQSQTLIQSSSLPKPVKPSQKHAQRSVQTTRHLRSPKPTSAPSGVMRKHSKENPSKQRIGTCQTMKLSLRHSNPSLYSLSFRKTGEKPARGFENSICFLSSSYLKPLNSFRTKQERRLQYRSRKRMTESATGHVHDIGGQRGQRGHVDTRGEHVYTSGGHVYKSGGRVNDTGRVQSNEGNYGSGGHVHGVAHVYRSGGHAYRNGGHVDGRYGSKWKSKFVRKPMGSTRVSLQI